MFQGHLIKVALQGFQSLSITFFFCEMGDGISIYHLGLLSVKLDNTWRVHITLPDPQ